MEDVAGKSKSREKNDEEQFVGQVRRCGNTSADRAGGM